MKLKEYVQTHPGEYVVAETRSPVTDLSELDPKWAGWDVEGYGVGVDPDGYLKVHLYATSPHVHILTYREDVQSSNN